MVANVVQRKISNGAEEPSPGIDDVLPVRVKFHKRFLNEVFRRFPLTHQSIGEAEQWGFLSLEYL